MKTNRAPSGFTLVEMAIVMVIIGLLIGAVIQGQAMINNARVKKIITTVANVQLARTTYRDKYVALPGDHIDAVAKLAGCTAARFCGNGNGNNIVGTTTTNYASNNQAGETVMFWKHLAIAGLLSNINPDANTSTQAWRQTQPECAGCGGYKVLHVSATAASPNPRTGHYLMIQPNATGAPNVSTSGAGAVNPSWAFEIDTKIDDGNANTGQVMAPSSNGLCADAAGVYNTAAEERNCIMIFKL